MFMGAVLFFGFLQKTSLPEKPNPSTLHIEQIGKRGYTGSQLGKNGVYVCFVCFVAAWRFTKRVKIRGWFKANLISVGSRWNTVRREFCFGGACS